MSDVVAKVSRVNGWAAFQDIGRFGMLRYGVPKGGYMDRYSAERALRLSDTGSATVVIEFAYGGFEIQMLNEAFVACVGGCRLEGTKFNEAAKWYSPGEKLKLQPSECGGVWSYLAISGGWDAEVHCGSASVHNRGFYGRALNVGDELRAGKPSVPKQVALRTTADAHPILPVSFDQPIPIHRGPEFDFLKGDLAHRFTSEPWVVTPLCDRTGYRLRFANDEKINEKTFTHNFEIRSEPLVVGALQWTPAGEIIVVMPDGPTVGGYPRIGWLSVEDVARIAQCSPGTHINWIFEP